MLGGGLSFVIDGAVVKGDSHKDLVSLLEFLVSLISMKTVFKKAGLRGGSRKYSASRPERDVIEIASGTRSYQKCSSRNSWLEAQGKKSRRSNL